MQKWMQQIVVLKQQMKNKEDNKEVSLSTSKINYMDPRVTVAWCKRVRRLVYKKNVDSSNVRCYFLFYKRYYTLIARVRTRA